MEVDHPDKVGELPEIKWFDYGIAVSHNFPCTVCRQKVAVLDMSTGIMQPCWTCQEQGYNVKKSNGIRKFFKSRIN